MSKVKKIIIGVLVVALAGAGAAGGLNQLRKKSQKTVMVVGVESLASDYYSPSTSLDANITTSVTQNISVDKDMIIDQVYVNQGDSVKKGDKLISFDMTLVEMELNIAKLKRQKLEQDLNKAVNRLNSLKNGGAVSEDDAADIDNADNLSSFDDETTSMDDDLAFLNGTVSGHYLAAAVQPILLAAFVDAVGEESAADAVEEGGEVVSEDTGEEFPSGGTGEVPGNAYQDVNAGEFSSGENTSSEDENFESGKEETPVTPEPTPTPALNEEVEFVDQVIDPGDSNITDGNEQFYRVLDGDTEPFAGSGTKKDPYIFLCSSAQEKVTVTGGFFNKMAGYSADGTQILKEGGSWYQLEFHTLDKIADYQNRKESCTGYYLVDGSLLKKPVDLFSETEFTLADALKYEDESDDSGDDTLPDYNGGDNGGSSLSRSDAIKIQQDRIASLKLDIQESDINISKLEKKVARQVIYSKLDGTVASVGDAATGTSDSESGAFMSIKNKDGFYVKGTVSELLLDKIKEGTMLNCTSYSGYDGSGGSFQAEVIEVSDYPVSTGGYSYDGNPNVSNYTFTAVIPDQSVTVTDGDYVSIMLAEEAQETGIVLDRAFVRTENGSSYVYKDDNGVLKKQVVSVGGNVNNGYSVLIKAGITREDKIAFPYGKEVQEGAKTKEGTMQELYGY